METILVRAARVNPLPCSIRRGIIYDEDVCAGYMGPDLRQDPWKRLHLVVRRDHDQGVVSLRRGNKALRNGHGSHFAEISRSMHAWRALVPLFPAR